MRLLIAGCFLVGICLVAGAVVGIFRRKAQTTRRAYRILAMFVLGAILVSLPALTSPVCGCSMPLQVDMTAAKGF